jgi:hypothetical protein
MDVRCDLSAREAPLNTDQILENAAVAYAFVARTTQSQGFGLNSHAVLLASSVNAGLSLEFYAKCLCQLFNGDYPHIHCLKSILARLPLEVQEELRANFDHGVTVEEREQVQHIETQSGAEIHIDYDSVVTNWSRVFVDGRYWFEHDDASRPPLHWFFFETLVGVMSGAITTQRSHPAQSTM